MHGRTYICNICLHFGLIVKHMADFYFVSPVISPFSSAHLKEAIPVY